MTDLKVMKGKEKSGMQGFTLGKWWQFSHQYLHSIPFFPRAFSSLLLNLSTLELAEVYGEGEKYLSSKRSWGEPFLKYEPVRQPKLDLYSNCGFKHSVQTWQMLESIGFQVLCVCVCVLSASINKIFLNYLVKCTYQILAMHIDL